MNCKLTFVLFGRNMPFFISAAFILTTFMPEQIVFSRSRFNRRAQQLLPVVNAIHNGITRDYAQPGELTIIDSLPNPVCGQVRHFSAKIFAGLADIGYNATKKIPF